MKKWFALLLAVALLWVAAAGAMAGGIAIGDGADAVEAVGVGPEKDVAVDGEAELLIGDVSPEDIVPGSDDDLRLDLNGDALHLSEDLQLVEGTFQTGAAEDSELYEDVLPVDPNGKPRFPIVIGNIDESDPQKYASFDRLLEYYILHKDSDRYHPKLAHMLMALSAAAYNIPGSGNRKLSVGKDGYTQDATPASKHLYYITKAFSDLGFTDYQAFNYYDNPNAPKYGSDNAAFTIGQKQLSDGGTLVLIVVRGSFDKDSSFASSDWVSNFRIDMTDDGRHYGFAMAAEKVYHQMTGFLDQRIADGSVGSDISYVITGHSRGAAVANLLALKLHETGVPNSRVFGYNFACPDTVRSLIGTDMAKGHGNIWNVVNTADAIGIIPGIIGDAIDGITDGFQNLLVNWDKYGNTVFYCNNWHQADEFDVMRTLSEDSSHNYSKYVRDLSRLPKKLYSRSQVAARRLKLGMEKGIVRIAQTFYPDYVAISLDLTKITVEDQVYTGKKLTPAITVMYDGTALKMGTDYSVVYRNNRRVGTATVTVTGKGRYTGKRTVEFRINPASVTGLALEGGRGKLIASWNKVGGVSGYQLKYYPKSDASSAKTVNISGADTVKRTVKGLKGKRIYCVRVRAFQKVDGRTYFSTWSAAWTVSVK